LLFLRRADSDLGTLRRCLHRPVVVGLPAEEVGVVLPPPEEAEAGALLPSSEEPDPEPDDPWEEPEPEPEPVDVGEGEAE
jgi:hypothetical protein